MSSLYEGIVQDLIDEFAKLPGVGPKGASRIAFHLLHTDREEATSVRYSVWTTLSGVALLEQRY